ncbi:MAG: GNAT family acetyltransferase [Burkholderiaceae bacterium]|jgi:ribosomal protein S18 acetylase RimI-like enzyme|nr:GNAT family acetyltransferase [Burkholderiaceae bacterium]
MHIHPFQDADEPAMIALRHLCGLARPWNNPARDIARKRTVQRDLFLVGEADGQVIASVMFGYDGHRGGVNYLAVAPGWQRRGLARRLMAEGETRLTALGCPKPSLQVRTGNTRALDFYRRLGYATDDAVSMDKRLIADK